MSSDKMSKVTHHVRKELGIETNSFQKPFRCSQRNILWMYVVL